MEKIKRLLIAVLCLAVLLSACQPTPEQEIVIQKDMDKLIESASAGADTTTTPADASEAAPDLYARLGAPASFSAEVVSGGGKLYVYADADVLLPNAELPIVRVRPAAGFTREQAVRMAEVLMGKDASYVQYDYDNMTKAECEREMERLRYAITNWEDKGRHIYDMRYDTRAEAEAALAQLTAKAASAPQSHPAYSGNFEFEPTEVYRDGKRIYNGNTRLDLFADNGNGIYSYLGIQNYREDFGMVDAKYIRDYSQPMDTLFGAGFTHYDAGGGLSITEGEAVAEAEAALAGMGIEGFAVAACARENVRTDRWDFLTAYHVIFKRCANGVIETCTDKRAFSNEYSEPWEYERIDFIIDDAGVFRFEYNAPYEVVESVLDKTELLPFERIREVFERMIVIVNNGYDENERIKEGDGFEHHIYHIRLGLASVPEEGRETGLLVPAWDFIGSACARSNGKGDLSQLDENERCSFLTINAVDGSIIDRSGY